MGPGWKRLPLNATGGSSAAMTSYGCIGVCGDTLGTWHYQLEKTSAATAMLGARGTDRSTGLHLGFAQVVVRVVHMSR